MELETLTIEQIQKGLLAKEFSAQDLAQSAFENIRNKDGNLHAFLEVTEDLAREQSRVVDKKIAEKENIGALAGVPCAIKDTILVKGVRCTAASKILENYVAPYDATVVENIKAADALIVGKTNMDEFGMGGSTENSAFGVTRNPVDQERVAGGSSGGSAASVAAKESVVALGEDTGGSIRLPASFCGVVVLKPTYGAVSRHGIIALASSLDQVSPAAKTVDDVEQVFRAIAGIDSMDATSAPYAYVPQERPVKGLVIGVPKEYFGEGLDPDVEQVVRRALS